MEELADLENIDILIPLSDEQRKVDAQWQILLRET